MTKTVIDNATVLDAMDGADEADAITSEAPAQRTFVQAFATGTLEGKHWVPSLR